MSQVYPTSTIELEILVKTEASQLVSPCWICLIVMGDKIRICLVRNSWYKKYIIKLFMDGMHILY